MIKKVWVIAFLMPALIMFILFYLMPLSTVVYTSLFQWNGNGKLIFIGLKNYIELFTQDQTFRMALRNTIIWGICATFIHVPFGVLISLILVKRPFGWRFIRSSYMLYNVMSRAALAVIFMFVFNPEVGLLNGIIRLLGDKQFALNWLFNKNSALFSVTLTWLFYAGIITLITMSELTSIPTSIYEAALIDGATNLQIDRYINLPLIRKVIGTNVIIAVTAVFKEFDILFMTTNGGPGDETINLSLMIYNNIFNSYRYGYANTIATTLIIMGVVCLLVCSKTFKMDEKAL